MAYCTSTDIQNKLGSKHFQRLVRELGDSTDNAAQIAAAIEKADALIDDYIFDRYGESMPFDTTPTLIKHISVDLSIFELSNSGPGTDQEKKDAQTLAIEQLEKLRDRKISLKGISETQHLGAMSSTAGKAKAIQ